MITSCHNQVFCRAWWNTGNSKINVSTWLGDASTATAAGAGSMTSAAGSGPWVLLLGALFSSVLVLFRTYLRLGRAAPVSCMPMTIKHQIRRWMSFWITVLESRGQCHITYMYIKLVIHIYSMKCLQYTLLYKSESIHLVVPCFVEAPPLTRVL